MLSELTEHKKNPWHMMLEIQILAWNIHKNEAGYLFIEICCGHNCMVVGFISTHTQSVPTTI
jgi:hypothetical protein